MSFSLQNYTTYSITSGTLEPEKWVERAVELGYPALGICDKNNLCGHIEFQELCKEAGIQPILGAEFRVTEDCTSKDSSNKGVVLLYVKDEQGYKNLVTLNNFAWTKVDDGGGFYYKPRLDINIIAQYAEGLVLVVPANDGAYTGEPTKSFTDFLDVAAEAFGADLYLGWNPADESTTEMEDALFHPLCDSGLATRIAVYNAHYPLPDQAKLYDVVRRVDNNRRNGAVNWDREVVDGFLPDAPYDSDGELTFLMEKCNYTIPTKTYFMPNPDLPVTGRVESEIAYHLMRGIDDKLFPGFDTDDWVQALIESDTPIKDVYDSLGSLTGRVSHERKSKYPDSTDLMQTLDVYADRLAHETGIIEKLGFLDYFLIVKDIVSYVDDLGEERGPARGSAAGSLFSYLLNITKVDPLEFGLLFERFLNEDRADLPDIDLDFSAEGRAAIKEYIHDKYGEEHVVSIGALDRMKIASAVKMIAKAYGQGIPDNNDEIVHYDDHLLTESLKQHVTQTARGEDELTERMEDPTFQKFYARHSDWFETVVMPLCETVVTTSTHAAGTLITAFPINECMPVFKQRGTVATQWRDRHCELRGFPKFDILGIKAVDIIGYTKKLVKERHDIDIPSIDKIPLDDADTFKIYCEGKTDGVFQSKSYLAKNYGRKLQPSEFMDVVVSQAILRPGPIDAGAPDLYEQMRKGEILPEYDHPDMIPVTEKTMGLIIFQEQMMETVKVIGQMSAVEADYVRKACGKKKFDEMAKWEEVFIDGGLEVGHEVETLNTLWHKVNAFAGYGFNLSHSVSYSIISYNHAWLKSRYPTEFWCSTLKYASTDAKRYDSLFNVKGRAVEEGIEFVYPNLFGFASDFYPADDNKIYWPTHAIKGIGEKTTNTLTDDGRRTKFESLDDMILTLGKDLNLGVYKTLIYAGFFEPIHPDPWEAARIVFERRNELLEKKDELPYEMSETDLLSWSIKRNGAFGFVVTPWKKSGGFHDKVMYLPESVYQGLPDGTKVFIGGYVESVKIRHYKQKKKGDGNRNRFYAVLEITDEGEKFKVMCWSDFWMNKQLDYDDNRPMKGDLVECIGFKSIWEPEPGKEIHQVKLGPKSHFRKVRETK